jgi:hypothetical protein
MRITEDELAQRFARLRAREKLMDDCDVHREELERAYPGGIPKFDRRAQTKSRARVTWDRMWDRRAPRS